MIPSDGAAVGNFQALLILFKISQVASQVFQSKNLAMGFDLVHLS